MTTSFPYQYVLTSETQELPVPEYFLLNGDIEVIDLDSEGSETLLVEDVDYTVDGAGDESGGSVTMIAGTIGNTITIIRSVPITQEIDFIAQGGTDEESVERGLDKLTMILQQLHGSKAVLFPATEPVSTYQYLPASSDRAGKFFGFDSSGDILLTSSTSAPVLDDDTLGGSTPSSSAAPSQSSVKNYIDSARVKQIDDDDYTTLAADSGKTIIISPTATRTITLANFSDGDHVVFIKNAAQDLVFAASSGSIAHKYSYTTSSSSVNYAFIYALKIGSEWILTGDLDS